MEFDIKKLSDDIKYMKEYLIRNEKASSANIATDLLEYAEFYDVLTESETDTDIYLDDKKVKKYLEEYYKDGTKRISNYIASNLGELKCLTEELSDCFDKKSRKFIYRRWKELIKTVKPLSEKEFIDIIYSFYSQFGDNVLNVVKKMFDEKRIALGHMGDSEADGNSIYSILTEDAFIGVRSPIYHTVSCNTLVHELGHTVHFYNIMLPSLKKKDIASAYIEVPSCTFEMLFLDYLMKNHIQSEYALAVINDRWISNMIPLCEYFHILQIDEEGKLIIGGRFSNKEMNLLKKRVGEYLRDDLLYTLGYSIGVNAVTLYRDDPKEFIKKLNDAMYYSSGNDLQEVIEHFGIDYDDYLSCKLIKPYLKEKNKELIRKDWKWYKR